MSVGAFADLLGFDKIILTEGTNFVGPRVPDITRSVDWALLHCDLVLREVTDVANDVLYSVSIVGPQVSYPFKETPQRLEFHPVNKSRIDSIRIRVTDGRNNPLNLNGVDVALSVMIEEA